MATNGSLNDMEQWRSVVTYRKRRSNPEHHWKANPDVPRYLDEWSDGLYTDTRGPYQSAANARMQAGRDAAALDREREWESRGGDRINVRQVVSVTVERSALAWEPFDVRDPEKGWGG